MNLTTKSQKVTFWEYKFLGIFKRERKFNVVADIPDSLLDDYAAIAKTDSNEENPEKQKEAFALMRKVIVSMLSPYNNKRKVKKFVDGMGIKSINKVFIFLNNYINDVDEEKKND